MISLVAPTITRQDEQHLAACAYDGRAFDERTVRAYEEAFAERVGCAGAVAVCSGTTALTLALFAEASPIQTQMVTVPTLVCSSVANAVGDLPYFTFSEPVDGRFDVPTARMIQESASVRVHSFGTWTGIRVGNVPPVEDWTLSLGCEMKLWGDVGVCSTHASKMLSTGRGGIVFSNDEALLAEVRALAYYDSTPNGTLGAHSLGMTSMQAALGLSQLRQLDAFIERRREIAAAYSNRFDAAGIECPDPDCGSVFFRYLIGVEDPGGKVDALKGVGVEAGRGVYPPLHRQLGLSDDGFPGATACVNRLLSVPCHPSLSDADVAFVAERVLEVCA